MNTHHISLYDEKTNPAPENVLKQELVTWEETKSGIRITRLKRSIGTNSQSDTYSSEHVLHSLLGATPQVEEAFDIAKSVDEGLTQSSRKLTHQQKKRHSALRKIATGGYLGRDAPYGVKRKD